MSSSYVNRVKKDDSSPILTDSGLIDKWVFTNIRGTTSKRQITISPDLVGISMKMIFNCVNTASLATVKQGQTSLSL
jgi:hypothetical protein